MLRVLLGDRVERVDERLAAQEHGERAREGLGGERAVEDVHRAEGLEEDPVLEGGGRDDGREALELRHLDGCDDKGVS